MEENLLMVADKFIDPILHYVYIRRCKTAKAHCTIKWYESNLVMVILFI